MRRLCTICARGGSKGVEGKNLRPLLGRPLVAHSISQARETGLFEYIAVSSDSNEILAVAEETGADYLIRRPDEMARDEAAKLPAIRHCLLEVERLTDVRFDLLTDLDATSPLRFLADIANAVALLEDRGVSNVITGARSRRSPYFNLVERGGDDVVRLSKQIDPPVVRRQDAPICFDMNASIYVWQRDTFVNAPSLFYSDTLLYEMPEDRSFDIDTTQDFEIVEFLMNKRTGA